MPILDRVIFLAASGGTGDFVEAAALQGYQTLAAANAIDGATYSYAAQIVDPATGAITQWEVGQGVYTLSTSTLARTTVLFNDLANTSPINFTGPPQVMITALAEDFPVIPSIRTILSATKDYYIATTGNDSNDGSVGAPWLTIQHAYNFISQKIDIGGQQINLNVGAGTFAGANIPSMVGGGFTHLVGAGSASTTITGHAGGSGDCFIINASSDTGHFWDFVKFIVGTNAYAVDCLVFNASIGFGDFLNQFSGVDVVIAAGFAGAFGGGVQVDAGTKFFAFGGTYTIDCTNNGFSSFFSIFRGAIVADGGSWTLLGTPTIFAAFCKTVQTGIYVSSGASFSGAANGQRFNCTTGGQIFWSAGPKTLGINFFPGNVPGFCDSQSLYDGFPFWQSQNTPPLGGNPLDDGAWGVIKDQNFNNTTLYANDGGTYKFACLLTPQTFASLTPVPFTGQTAVINDGLAGNCADGLCTTFGTAVFGGGGALQLRLWYNGTNWTLTGK